MIKRRRLTALRFVSPAVFLSIVLCLIVHSTRSTAEQQTQSPTTAATPQTSIANQDGVVTFTLTVSTGERDTFAYVAGLDKQHFTVQEKSATPEIVFFDNQIDAPFSIGVLIDTSDSMFYMGDKKKALTFEAELINFFRLGHADNEYFLAKFDTKTTLLRDWTHDPAGTFALQRKSTAGLGTSLYDACYFGVEKVLTGKHQRKALIVVSDGGDNTSKRKFKEIERLAKNTDVLIYALNLGAFANNESVAVGASALYELAYSSGGRHFFPETAVGLHYMIELLAADLRNKYRIGIKASDQSAKWREVKINVTLPPDAQGKRINARVRSRQGYTPISLSQ